MKIEIKPTGVWIDGIKQVPAPEEQTYTPQEIKDKKIAVRCDTQDQVKAAVKLLGGFYRDEIPVVCLPVRIFWGTYKSNKVPTWGWVQDCDNYWLNENGFTIIPFSQVRFEEQENKDSLSKPSKQPLFKTEDGKEVYEGDKVFVVENWRTLDYTAKGAFSPPDMAFSTRSAAEQYISENRPLYSKEQVADALAYVIQKRDESELIMPVVKGIVKEIAEKLGFIKD